MPKLNSNDQMVKITVVVREDQDKRLIKEGAGKNNNKSKAVRKAIDLKYPPVKGEE